MGFKYNINELYWFVKFNLKDWALRGEKKSAIESRLTQIELKPMKCISFDNFENDFMVEFIGVDGHYWKTTLPKANPAGAQTIEAEVGDQVLKMFDFREVLEGLIDSALNPQEYGFSKNDVLVVNEQYKEFVKFAMNEENLCIYRRTPTTVEIQKLDLTIP